MPGYSLSYHSFEGEVQAYSLASSALCGTPSVSLLQSYLTTLPLPHSTLKATFIQDCGLSVLLLLPLCLMH